MQLVQLIWKTVLSVAALSSPLVPRDCQVPDSVAQGPQAGAETEQGGYDWFRAWYPLTPVEYLDPKKPQGIQLLGKKLVLWKDETGNWSCLEDVCPHR